MTNFGHVLKDRKLATSDRQTKSDHWYENFGHFLVTNISFSTSDNWLENRHILKGWHYRKQWNNLSLTF